MSVLVTPHPAHARASALFPRAAVRASQPRRFERAPAVRSIAWSALFAANCATFVMAVLSHGFSLATAEDVVSALGLAITLWAFSLCCCVLEGLLSQPILVFVMDSKSGWNDDPSMREPILALVQYGSVRFWCGCSDRAAVDLLLYALAFLSFFTADMTGYATASLGIIHSMRFFAEVSTAYTMLAGLAERLKYLCAAEILARCEEAVAATSEWEQWRQHVLLGRCHLANHILWHATVGHGHRQLAQAAKRHDLPPIAQRLQQQQEQQQHDLPPIVPSPAEAAVAPSSGSRPERTL